MADEAELIWKGICLHCDKEHQGTRNTGEKKSGVSTSSGWLEEAWGGRSPEGKGEVFRGMTG